MSRRAPLPTEAELQILTILWEKGASTVLDVHAELGRHRAIGYTTALKQLQRMLDKGLVTRDESNRSHVYAAAVPRSDAEHHLVNDLLDRAFSGSTSRLVVRVLSGRQARPEEIQEIRRLVERLEERERDA